MQRKWRRVEETSIAASLTTLEPSSDEEDESDAEIVRNIEDIDAFYSFCLDKERLYEIISFVLK